MRTTVLLSGLFFLGTAGTLGALALGGCNKSGGGAAAPISIDQLGLKAKAPAGTTVGAALMGPGVMIQGPDLMVTVAPADKKPATLKDAKADNSMYTPVNVKEETLPDGWALSFENKGGMGTNYWVQVRRTIGGKAYWCDTNGNSADQQANALAACKSLSQ